MYTIKNVNKMGMNVLYIKELNNYILINKRDAFDEITKSFLTESELLDIIGIHEPDKLNKFKQIIECRSQTIENSEKQAEKYSFYTLCIHVSRKCNIKCKYCFANDDKMRSTNEINIDTIKNAIDFLIYDFGKKGKRFIIDLAGSGEPLLKFNLIKKIEDYCEIKRKETGKNINIMFPTNGTLLNKEMIDYFMSKPNILLGLSLDGNERQNKNRIYNNEKETFNTVVSNIAKIKPQKLGISVTLSNINEDVDQVYDYIVNNIISADSVAMNLVRDYRNDSETSFYKIDISNLLHHYELLSYRIIEELLNENYTYFEKLLLGDDLFGNYILRVLNRGQMRLTRCGAGKNTITVDYNGDLYACSVGIGKSDFFIGNIYRGILSEKQEKFNKLSVDKCVQCRKCWASYICGGECLITSLETNGVFLLPNEYVCKVRKGLIELSIALVNYIKSTNEKGYKYLLKMFYRKTFFQSVIDSGLWAAVKYLNSRNIDYKYTDLMNKLNTSFNGTHPQNLETALKQYIVNVNVFKLNINDCNVFRQFKFPIIAYINDSKSFYYQYIIIKDVIDNEILIKRFDSELIESYPLDEFINNMDVLYFVESKAIL